MFHHVDWCQEFAKLAGRLALDREGGALGRPVLREHPDDHRAADPYCLPQRAHVAAAVVVVEKKVQHGAVMPNIPLAIWFPPEHVLGQPRHGSGGADAGAGNVKCYRGHIQNGNVGVTVLEQVINQR